jgi:hypothetical protein
MAKSFRYNDHIRWKTPQRRTVGRAAKRMTKTRYARGGRTSVTPPKPGYLFTK